MPVLARLLRAHRPRIRCHNGSQSGQGHLSSRSDDRLTLAASRGPWFEDQGSDPESEPLPLRPRLTMIPSDFIQTLLSRVDIVEVIDRYVPLRKAGANYAGVLSVPQRKDPVVHRQSRQAVLSLLRLRRPRYGDRFSDGVRRQELSRRRRGARARRRARGAARRAPRRARAARRGGGPHRAPADRGEVLPERAARIAPRDRVPQGSRTDRCDRRALRHRLRARWLAAACPHFPRLRRPGARCRRTRDQGRRWKALRPFPRSHRVPDPRRTRPRHRLRWTRARQG